MIPGIRLVSQGYATQYTVYAHCCQTTCLSLYSLTVGRHRCRSIPQMGNIGHHPNVSRGALKVQGVRSIVTDRYSRRILIIHMALSSPYLEAFMFRYKNRLFVTNGSEVISRHILRGSVILGDLSFYIICWAYSDKFSLS